MEKAHGSPHLSGRVDYEARTVSLPGVLAAFDHALDEMLAAHRTLPPGCENPALGAESFPSLADTLDALRVVTEVEAALSSRRLALAASVFYDRAVASPEPDERRREGACVDAVDRATGEIGAALTVTPSVARDLVATGRRLAEEFPLVDSTLAAGRVDEKTARSIMSELDGVSAQLSPRLESEAVRAAAGTTSDPVGTRIRGRRLANLIRRRALELDPDHVREQRTRALARRRVTVTPLRHGLVRVETVVSADAGLVIEAAVDSLARRSGRLEVPREDQTPADKAAAHQRRRADALVSLCADAFLTVEERGVGPLVGVTAVEYVADVPAEPAASAVYGSEVPTAAPPAPGTLGSVTDLYSRLSALPLPRDATSARPRARPTVRWLVGYGWVDAEADTTPSVQVHFDPYRGLADPPRLGYRIPDWLARQVRLRDGHCMFPGCDVPAQRCDLDHVTPFDHTHPERGGSTDERGLLGECRLHHRLKTHAGWRVRRVPGSGHAVVTSPSGGRYTTRPDGPLERTLSQYHRARRRDRPSSEPAA